MATTTLVTVAPTGGTSAKAYNKGTATTATNGTATSVSYSGTRVTLLTVVWTDLADGDYDFALIGPDGELGYDVLRVSGALSVLLSEQNLAQLAGASSIVERSPTDAKAIKFRFPVSGATITGTVSIDNAASFSAVTGAISFLHTVEGKHWYVLAYNAADRPTSEGTAHYKFTDGTNKAEIKLRVQSREELDRLGYLMAQEIGACSDAGTSGETYAITIGTTTYTIDHTGLTSAGVRGTATLTKS